MAQPGPTLTPEEHTALAREAKAAFRTRLGALRRALPKQAQLKRSSAICEFALKLPEFQSADNIASYLPFAGEVNLTGLHDQVHSSGKSLFLPRMNKDTHAVDLLKVPEDFEQEESGYSFMQPADKYPVADLSEIDLICIPALAADLQGHRVGWGKGHYDHLLPQCTRALRVITVYDFQLLAELPNEPHDTPAHILITDKQTHRV